MFQFEPFRDSTDHLNVGEILRARLAEDGYLFLRGLLPREAILAVRGRLLNKAAQSGWLAQDSPVAVGIANTAAACKDPEPRYLSVFRDLWSDEALHRLRIDPRVIALFDRSSASSLSPMGSSTSCSRCRSSSCCHYHSRSSRSRCRNWSLNCCRHRSGCWRSRRQRVYGCGYRHHAGYGEVHRGGSPDD
jgi:hypothetical protein